MMQDETFQYFTQQETCWGTLKKRETTLPIKRNRWHLTKWTCTHKQKGHPLSWDGKQLPLEPPPPFRCRVTAELRFLRDPWHHSFSVQHHCTEKPDAVLTAHSKAMLGNLHPDYRTWDTSYFPWRKRLSNKERRLGEIWSVDEYLLQKKRHLSFIV